MEGTQGKDDRDRLIVEPQDIPETPAEPENNGPDVWKSWKDREELIAGRWKERIGAELGQWLLINYSDDNGVRKLEILKGPDGRAARTITRHADGTVSVDNAMNPGAGKILLERAELTKHVREWIIGRFIQEVIENAAPKAWRSMADLRPTGLDYIREAVEELEAKHLSESNMPPTKTKTPKKARLDTLAQDANRIVRSKLVHTDTFKQANATFHGSSIDKMNCTAREYSEYALNGDILNSLAKTSPAVKDLYCEHMVNHKENARSIEHPGEIVKAVQQKLDLKPSEWKIFCRLGPRQFRQLGIVTIEGMRAACQDAAAVNRPRAPTKTLIQIVSMGNTHDRFKGAQWEAGDAWQAWTNALARYVDLGDTDYRQLQELNRISDALMGAVNAGEAWGPGDWDTLVARSERWHATLINRRMGIDRNLTWKSQIVSVDIGEHTYTAVTKSAELTALGQRMGNCLGTFWRQCSEGTSRIFTVAKKDSKRLLAAVEIQKAGYIWRTGQMEGPHRGGIPVSLPEECKKLCALYVTAEQDASQPKAA